MNLLRACLVTCIAFGVFGCSNEVNQSNTNSTIAFELKEGDILFQDIDCGDYCESIETVTQGYKGADLSHCGIVVKQNNGNFVIEAISKGVVLTPIDTFLNRAFDEQGNPKVLVGRVNQSQVLNLNAVVSKAKSYLGRPYDAIYTLNDSSLYCSELVYFSYLNSGKPIFSPNPMTFKPLNSDSTFVLWATYFNELNVEIPEGKLGLNPGGISKSSVIDIVHAYGFPEHMERE